MSSRFKKTLIVGDNRKLKWQFPSASDDPLVITEYSFVLDIDNGAHTVNGELIAGDFRAHFQIPAAVYNAAGSYDIKMKTTLPSGESFTNLVGTLTYT